MKRVLLFILPILIIIALGFAFIGNMQVRFTEERLMDDLKRKAKTVAESLEFSARYILSHQDLRAANRAVEIFQKKERLQGCVIYDKDGRILAITERFSDWQHKDKPYLKEILELKNARGALETFQDYSVYSYILPVLDDGGSAIGLVEVIYDTSYLFNTLADLWRRLHRVLFVLIIFITGVAFLIQWQIFILPVRRLTRWFEHFQKGETDSLRPFQEKGEFGKLIREVEQVALTLRVARKVVSDEAQVRLDKEEIWTESKLRDLVRAKLGGNALIVVSNREPYMHVSEEVGDPPRCLRPASGVVTAIDPIMRACGGTWVAHGSANADRNFVNSRDKLGVPPEDNRYILKRVWLSKDEEEGYYYGFSNEGLWPLCHVTHTRPIFRESDWQRYKKVNEKFAASIVEELPANNPFVFIQDYHFTLLPLMIKEKRPDVTVALFWHIPWPNPEVFAICPYHLDILDGMLGCDLIGFHVQNHCNNFLDTANRLIECRVDTEKFSIVSRNKETLVRSFPISVNGFFSREPAKPDTEEIQKIKREWDLQGKIVGVGVERIDYTKGIIERILAIDRFLEKFPEYRKKFVFIQIAAPSRTHIKRYHDLIAEIDGLIEKKNWKYSEGNWQPIIYLKRHFSSEEIKPYYAAADFCVVSSLHDGMNLVAKEYVATRHDCMGALILSKFTGAARELTDAVLINPYSIEEFADAIKYTIDMPLDEKRKRMEKMRKNVAENNVYRWAGNIIAELAALKKI